MNKPLFFSQGFGVLLAAGLLSTGCGETSLPPAPGPPIVTVAVPVEQTVTDHVDFSGKTAAVESVELRARVGGYLQTVQYTEGNEAKKDQVLFGVDPRPYQIELERAQARVKAAKAQAADSESTYQRTARLYRSAATSAEQLEKDRRTRDVSAAALDAAQANVQLKQINRDFANVLSPIDGRVDKADVTVGNMVSANLNDATILTNIVRMEPMYAYFDVDEHSVQRVRQMIHDGKAQSARDSELPVWLGLANEARFPHQGTVNFVDNQVNPKTGTLRLRGVFPNKDEMLTTGYFARVRVPIGFPHRAVLVSDRALDTDQGQKVVYVVDKDNKVDTRPVRLGALHDGLREITDGLKPGERVIVKGLQQVRPGAIVEPTVVEMPKGNSRSPVQTDKPKAGS